VQGGGELILTGANTYFGDTIINESTLSISSSYLADAADVALIGDAILDLVFAGADTIDELLLDGVAQAAGSWGAIGSGATNEDARFTGSGRLMVTTGGSGAGVLSGSSIAVPEPPAFNSAVFVVAICFGFGRFSKGRLG
jgi:autotransporter-associated beta strand protein